ncbi:hypothetical protein BKA63DRAFT_275404 [Paraphoma chrysanthemicola]|nr:hypothetical protein BKA63DRAFT_275404 [Paraphoma chrysanthemicola]
MMACRVAIDIDGAARVAKVGYHCLRVSRLVLRNTWLAYLIPSDTGDDPQGENLIWGWSQLGGVERLRSGVRNRCDCRGVRAEYVPARTFMRAACLNTGSKRWSKSRLLQAMMQCGSSFLLVPDKLSSKKPCMPRARSAAVANMSEACSVAPPNEDSSTSPSQDHGVSHCHAQAVAPQTWRRDTNAITSRCAQRRHRPTEL